MATPKGPQQQRAEERREQKLADIRAQIAAGKLTVRQMTPDERKLQPKPPAGPPAGAGRAKRPVAARRRGPS